MGSVELANAKVLAEKSLHFRQLFLSKPKKEEGKEKEPEFEVTSVEIENFIRLLELVHNVETDICEDNATGVLETIIKFKAPECFEMCDKILRDQELNDIMQVLEWVDKYPLPRLKVLAAKSLHFCYLFSSNPGISEFVVEHVELEYFIRFLELVHNVDTDICEDNATGVLEAIVKFKAPECFEMCDKILKAQELNDKMQVLEWVDKYPLPGLRKKFLLKLKDETLFKLVTHPSTYRSLSSDMKVAIDECKLIPEENETEEVERNDYKFCTDFRRKNGSTDVEIEILANASNFFLKQFYGPLSDGSSRIVVVNVSSQRFEILLTHIYHPSRPVTCSNIVSLLQLARQFSVPRLMDKCEEYLVLKDSIQLIDKLEYAGLYDLRFLLESCLKWAKDKEKMNEVKSHRKFRRLQPRVVTELMNREAEESKRN